MRWKGEWCVTTSSTVVFGEGRADDYAGVTTWMFITYFLVGEAGSGFSQREISVGERSGFFMLSTVEISTDFLTSYKQPFFPRICVSACC